MSSQGITPPDNDRPTVTAAEIADRIARLPVRGISRVVIVTMAAAFFFDLGDQTALGLVAPALRTHLGFDLNAIAVLVSATYCGLLIGATIGGRLSDRYGRLPVIGWSLALASLGSGVHALVDGLPELIVLRIVSAIGMGALFITSVSYVVEMSPRHKRGSRTALTYFVGLAGSTLLTFLARAFIPLGPDGWRLVFLVGLFGLGVLPLLRLLPESPLWLHSRGRVDEAVRALERLEAGTAKGRELPPIARMEIDTSAEEATRAEGRWTELFRSPLLRPTVLLCLIWIVYAALTQTFANWLATILQLRGFGSEELLTIVAIANLGGPLGALVVSLIADRISRRTLLVVTSVVAALCGALFGLAPSAAVIAVCAFGTFFMIAWFAPLLNASMAEAFPAAVRATGGGVAFGSGRLTNVVVPFTLAVALGALGAGFVGWFMLAGWLVAGAAAVVLVSGRRPDSASTATVQHPVRQQEV